MSELQRLYYNGMHDKKRWLDMIGIKRHFYISNDPADLEALEQELCNSGISWTQIHVLTDNDAAVGRRRLHRVASLFKKDIVHGSKVGFWIGAALASIVLLSAAVIGMPEPFLWVPVIVFALLLLGFCTWEGGLIGIQKPNPHYTRFEKVLRHGKHVLIVDVTSEQEDALRSVMKEHPRVHFAGFGEPDWVVGLQEGM